MKKSSFWLFFVIGTITVYALFVMFSDVSALIKKFQIMDIKYVLMGVTVVFLGLVVRAFRWFRMMKDLGNQIDLKSCVMIYFSGTAFGLTPGRLGEVIKSYYLKRLNNTSITNSAPTIIVERFLDIFAILIIAFLSFFLTGIQSQLTFVGLGFIGFSLFLIYNKALLIRFLKITESIPLLGKVSKKLFPSIDVLVTLSKPKSLIQTLPLSILSWFLESMVIYFVLKAFGLQISLITSAFIFVISSLIGSISFLPGGVGATEGGLLGLFYLQHITYNDAVGPILVIRIIVLWMTIIFGVIMNRITETTILKNK